MPDAHEHVEFAAAQFFDAWNVSALPLAHVRAALLSSTAQHHPEDFSVRGAALVALCKLHALEPGVAQWARRAFSSPDSKVDEVLHLLCHAAEAHRKDVWALDEDELKLACSTAKRWVAMGTELD